MTQERIGIMVELGNIVDDISSTIEILQNNIKEQIEKNEEIIKGAKNNG